MSISSAQHKVIVYIEENLGLKFLGTTSKDAQKFISKYMDTSKYVYDKHRKIGLFDEKGEELCLGDMVIYNNNEYTIVYEIGAYMLARCSDVDMYDEFKGCWNDDVYPLAQLYWNGDNEENYINGLTKVKTIKEEAVK